MKIPAKLVEVLAIYAIKGVEYVFDRLTEKKDKGLKYKDVEHIRAQVDSATKAARASAKTVVVPRTPNRYDE
jgi:hypothetical protein